MLEMELLFRWIILTQPGLINLTPTLKLTFVTSAKNIKYLIWTFYALKYQPISRVKLLKDKKTKYFISTESFY